MKLLKRNKNSEVIDTENSSEKLKMTEGFGLTDEQEYKEIVGHLQMVYDSNYDLVISSKDTKQREDFIEECRTVNPVINVFPYYKRFFNNKIISKKRLEKLVKERKDLLKKRLDELKKKN